jgi:hypothetical protein
MPKSKKPTKLTDIALREVSFVDSPANPHASVILAKRDTEVDKGGPDVGDVHVASTKITGVKMKNCASCAAGTCTEHKVGKGMFAKILEMVGLASSGDTVEDLTKLNETVLSFEKDDNEDDTGGTDSGDDDTDDTTKMGKNMPANKEDVLKGLTPEQREVIQKSQTEAVELAKAEAKAEAEKEAVAKATAEKAAIEKANVERIEKAEAEVRKLRQERDDEARLLVAKGLVSKSGVSADAVSNILKQLDEEGAKQFKEILTKTEAFAEGSRAFEELGKDFHATSTTEQVKKEAADLRKANPNMTEAQAIAKVYETKPELYETVLNGN